MGSRDRLPIYHFTDQATAFSFCQNLPLSIIVFLSLCKWGHCYIQTSNMYTSNIAVCAMNGTDIRLKFP